MTEQNPQPQDNERENVGEANVERLLAKAYRPETPDSAFAERVAQAMTAEAARRRDRAGSQHRHFGARLVTWALAASLLLALGIALGHLLATARPGSEGDAPDRIAGGDSAPKPIPRLVVARPSEAAQNWPFASALTARRRTERPEVAKLAVGQSLETGQTERRRIELPDGSILYLNRNTAFTLEAPRRIALEQGEIYLEVAPQYDEEAGNASNAAEIGRFVVVTPDRELISMGTKFNVRADDEGTSVAVTQGKVQVSGVDEPLAAGQQLLSDDEAEVVPIGQTFHLIDWTRELVASHESPLVPASKHAGGALVAKRPDGQEASLSMRRYKVDVHIEDGFARTTIDQTYFNHETRRLEGTFFFPLPPDASLSRLAMYVNGKLMEGGMAERQHARQTFEKIVRTQKDPALLEWIDGSTFRMRVFPLEGRQEKRIVLSYTQRLDRLGDRVEYRFPGGHNMSEVGQWSCHVQAKGASDCRWEADSYDFEATTTGKDLALDAAAEQIRPDRNLVVRLWDPKSKKASPGRANAKPRFVSADHEDHRYLALRYPFQPGGGRESRRDWVFLFEASADRDPVLARVQVDVVKTLLENAERDDTFTILAASSRIRSFAEKPVAARAKNVKRAVDYLEKTQLVGALDLEKAFRAAAHVARQVENPCVVHLGSGYPKLGEDDHEALAKLLPEETTYVGVAVGNRWNRALMKRMAGDRGGYFAQINPNEPVTWRAIELISRLNAPRLTKVSVVDDREKLQFLNMSDVVCEGEELFSVARLDPDANLPQFVEVTGLVDGQPFSERVPVADVVEAADYLPRTWSKLQIDRLVADDSMGHHDEIVNLSMAMYVMSPFTSLLVLENEQMYKQYNVDRGRKDHWAMYACPEKIKVVHEPMQAAVKPPAKRDTTKPDGDQVLRTILVRGSTWGQPNSPALNMWQLSQPGHVLGNRWNYGYSDRLHYRRGNWFQDIARPLEGFDGGQPGSINLNTVTWDYDAWGLRNTLDVDFDRSVTVGMTPGVFSADLDVPFPLAQYRMLEAFWSDQTLPPQGSSYVELWDVDSDGDGVDIERAFQEMVESETRNVIDQARRNLETDPDISVQNLKNQIETIRQITEMDPDRSGQLLEMLEAALRHSQQRKAIVEKRWQEQSERISVTESREHILSEINQREAKIGQLTRRFDPLMEHGKYRYAEEAAVSEVELFNPESRTGIAGTLKARSLGYLTDAMTLRVMRQKGVVDTLYHANLSHLPFPDEPPILYPPADVWAELTRRRTDSYRPMDFGARGLASDNLYATIDIMDPIVVDHPDGIVTHAGRGDKVSINLGRVDGLSLLTNFSVYERFMTGTTTSRRKGAIRVTELQDHSAVATIVEENGSAPILAGDKIFNELRKPLAHPNVHDLLVYAPGMHTTRADVLAVLDREAKIDDKPETGKVDPQARQLIDRARQGGWRRLVVDEDKGIQADLVFDGRGRFRAESETTLGLKETLVGDGKHLWHLYPELGVGAKRPASRFYGNMAQNLIPWLVPSAEELARGADVIAVDDHTVAVVPHGRDEGELDGESAALARDSGRCELRLVFAADGRLAERQIVRSESEEILLRETYDGEGTIRLFDDHGKERLKYVITTESCEAPELEPDPSLVVVPMPWRTREHVFAARGLKDDGAHKDWTADDALAVLAAETASRRKSMLSTIGWRFLAKGDHRPGFYTLLLAARVDWNAKADDDPNGVHHLFAPLESSADELIAHYVSALQKSRSDGESKQIGVLGGTGDGFIRRLAELHDLWTRWQAVAVENPPSKELTELEGQTAQFVRHDPIMAFVTSAFAAVAQYGGKESLARVGDATEPSLREAGRAAFGLRFFHADALARTDQVDRGRQLLVALIDDMLDARIVPLIDQGMKDAFFPSGKPQDVWKTIAKRLTEASLDMPGPQALTIAQRLHKLGETDSAERILAASTMSSASRTQGTETLAAVNYLWQTNQRRRAEAMLDGLLSNDRYQKSSTLWRLASAMAEKQGRPARAAECLDRALALEFDRLPEEVELPRIRTDYGKLLKLLGEAVDEVPRSDRNGRSTLISCVVGSADRWRSLDPKSGPACRLAAAALAQLGATDLAWDYVTSPMADDEEAVIQWDNLGATYHRQGQYDLAERTYELAFECEPGNAELLWSRAQVLMEAGRRADARVLFEAIAEGAWKPEYAGIQKQARQLLRVSP